MPPREMPIARWAVALVIAGMWLVYLAQPINAAWALRGTPRGMVGLVALLTFTGLYLVHFHLWRVRHGLFADEPDHPPTDHRIGAIGPGTGPRSIVSSPTTGDPLDWTGGSRTALARFVGLLALACMATATTGQPALATWVFLAIAGLFTFRVRVAALVGLVITVGLIIGPSIIPGMRHDASAPLSAVLGMVAVGGVIVASRRRRQIAAMQAENARLELEQGFEQERSRMARDLHDILGHTLTVVTLKTDLARRLLDRDPEHARAELADIERLTRDALADVRATIAGLTVLTLPGELAQARAALAAAEVDADVPTHTDDVPSDRRELFAWAIREAVTNVVRHSHASHCTITLGADEVTIVDDGLGCPDPDGRPGSGLRGLQQRADRHGARVITQSLQPHGFSVAVTMEGRA